MDNVTVTAKEIRVELDERYQKDLNAVLQTEEGRRVFSYLLMDCGLYESFPQGNSKDIFMQGRRAVAVALLHAAQSIWFPQRTSGLLLTQMAEREYTALKFDIHDKLQERKKRAQNHTEPR